MNARHAAAANVAFGDSMESAMKDVITVDGTTGASIAVVATHVEVELKLGIEVAHAGTLTLKLVNVTHTA